MFTLDPTAFHAALDRRFGFVGFDALPAIPSSGRKEGTTIVALWVPDELLAALDAAVLRNDTDRSKLIRQAIRKQLLRPTT